MSDSTPDIPLILLPGIGVDARVFTIQQMQFPQLVVPEWLPPQRRESLPDYAARMAAACHPGRPCVVGGMSFGGMVALEMTRHLPAAACVLIASVKSADELPWTLRSLGVAAFVLPNRTDWLVAGFGTALKHTIGRVLPRRGQQLCNHLSRVRSPLIPWAWRASLRWRPSGDWPCPVFHLHGDADPIFPSRRTTPDKVIPNGGHLLPVSHPYEVNEFLRRCLQQVAAEAQG